MSRIESFRERVNASTWGRMAGTASSYSIALFGPAYIVFYGGCLVALLSLKVLIALRVDPGQTLIGGCIVIWSLCMFTSVVCGPLIASHLYQHRKAKRMAAAQPKRTRKRAVPGNTFNDCKFGNFTDSPGGDSNQGDVNINIGKDDE